MYRGRAQGSQGSGGVPRSCLCVRYAFPRRVYASLFLRLLVRTHSSKMTTTGNKGGSSKRGAQRRGQLRGDGGAPAGKAAQAAQRGRRSAADFT